MCRIRDRRRVSFHGSQNRHGQHSHRGTGIGSRLRSARRIGEARLNHHGTCVVNTGGYRLPISKTPKSLLLIDDSIFLLA